MRKLLAYLRAVTGPAQVLAEPDVVAGYATDWTRRYAGVVTFVVSPGSSRLVPPPPGPPGRDSIAGSRGWRCGTVNLGWSVPL